MVPTPFAREREVALAVAREAAAFIRSHTGRVAVRAKGTHDLVTDVDAGAQRLIHGRLRTAFPGDAFLGEEDEADALGLALGPYPGRRWIVDPLDGTTNFAHGIAPYAVSIALEVAGRPVVGVVLDVPHNEAWVAAEGAGLTLNGEPAGVSGTTALDEALLATGFPFREYGYVDGYLEAFEAAIRGTRGVRRHGSAAVDLAWVAGGRFDGFFEAGLAPWDVAAGVLLVREGGGRATGLDGAADPVFSGGIVASGPGLHGAMLTLSAPLSRAFARSRDTAAD